MKVRYEKEKYHVSFLDKLYINYLKAILICKRFFRRTKFLLSKDTLLMYSLITIFWIIFGIATYFYGQAVKSTEELAYTGWDVLWDLKNSYFTSVILAFVINSLNRTKEYKRTMQKQHYLYTDALADFNNIVSLFFVNKAHFYSPLYSEKTFNNTQNYILNECTITIDCDQQILFIDDILKRLDDIEQEYKKGNIIVSDDVFLLHEISCARKKTNKLVLDGNLAAKAEIVELSKKLFELLEILREPWRKDVKIKIDILSRLDKYEINQIKDDFYYSMLLYGDIESK